MLGLPERTEFNKRIPKQKFYENMDVSPALKRVFVEQIRIIYWRNKLAATTMNIAAGEEVTEIEVFEVRVQEPQFDEAVLRQIDKEIPYHILFLLTCDRKEQAWIGYKEAAASGSNAFKVSRYYHTDWVPEGSLNFSIDGLNIDSDLSGTAENGKAELGALIGKQHGFDTVKPVQLIKYLIQTFTDKDDIIFDFFSGSGTTAQAVMEQNSEDDGHRKYVMIQIEEECDPDGEAYRAGFRTICDIGQSRIKAVAQRIKDNESLLTKEHDVGFRVFTVADSNMKDVYYAADELDQQTLADMVSNIKEDRTALDLFFGCLLDWGLPLSMPYHSEEIDGCTVHTYNDGDLIACFDKNIPESVVKEIAKRKPLRAVFRDAGFADSPAKITIY